jgi:hypothetical protein
MLVRDISGRLNIINRKDCKNDADYYQKLLKIRTEYIGHYKSVIDINTIIRNDTIKEIDLDLVKI